MQPSDRSSRLGRSISTATARNSARLSVDDDYDLIASAVSDGFRPSASVGGNGSTLIPSSQADSGQFSNASRQSPWAAPPAPKGPGDLNRPLSTSKPLRRHDPLTLQNDGLTSSRNGQPSSSATETHGDAHHAATSQPSHPYHMYPQRTYSNATSSTEQPRGVETAQGPTHPYALYTQNTATQDDLAQRSIPVGFNDTGDRYRRQIGPDGEEAGDLIGPLGHTEELPPYTRYPDQAYGPNPPQVFEATTPSSSDASATTGDAGLAVACPTWPIPGAGGIGLATRNPEFSSTEDDLPGAPHGSGSVRSVPSVESCHQLNGAARDHAEKSAASEWRRRAKKKLCGVVPYWAICLLLSGIVVLGIVMGAVIGTVVARHGGDPPAENKDKYKDKWSGQEARYSNVEYLEEFPSNLPPLDTGCYALPTLEKYRVPKACIRDSSQSPAWSCDTLFHFYALNVTRIPETTDKASYALKLAPFDPRASRPVYGSQPPDIPDFQRLHLVKDLEEKNRGPAWYLEMEYNKTVIVRENQLQGPSVSASPPPASTPGADKRHRGPPSPPGPGFNKPRFTRKAYAAVEGDKPWICTWPNVKLQIFIFPNQTFPRAATSSPPPGPMSTGGAPSDGPSPPNNNEHNNSKEPYSKLIKFVERRPEDSPGATCTQYLVLEGGREKAVNHDENHKPITIKINKAPSKNTRSIVSNHSPRLESWDFPSLHDREVGLTPCGCVSFSWSV